MHREFSQSRIPNRLIPKDPVICKLEPFTLCYSMEKYGNIRPIGNRRRVRQIRVRKRFIPFWIDIWIQIVKSFCKYENASKHWYDLWIKSKKYFCMCFVKIYLTRLNWNLIWQIHILILKWNLIYCNLR